MAYHYIVDDVIVLSKERFVKEKLEMIKRNSALFGITPSEAKLNELANKYKEQYEDAVNRGVYDIGTITKYFVKISISNWHWTWAPLFCSLRKEVGKVAAEMR